MDNAEIEKKVVRVIGEVLVDGRHDGITPELSLTDLGADDLDHIIIVLELEHEFDIVVTEIRWLHWATVGDVIGYVRGALA